MESIGCRFTHPDGALLTLSVTLLVVDRTRRKPAERGLLWGSGWYLYSIARRWTG